VSKPSKGNELLTASGSGSGTATGAATTNRPHVVRDAVNAFNSQVKQSAERLDRTAKHLTGADKTDSAKADDAS
jgi:DNA gyrase/topoisomerase IV subunit A